MSNDALASPHGQEDAELESIQLPSCSALDLGAGLQEVAIVKAIEEHFVYHHLHEPLAAFKRDVEAADLRSVPSRASTGVTREIKDAMDHFDAGRREHFMTAWQRIMPVEFHASKEGKALTLRLHAHWATLRSRHRVEAGGEPDNIELQEDLVPFRIFLNEKGTDEVSGDEVLMPLFALPFVQRPHVQPNLREVFTAKWLDELRKDVDAAMHSRHPPLPVLYDIFDPSPVGRRSDAAAWQDLWAELVRVADASLDAAALLAQGVLVPAEVVTAGQRQLEMLREKVPGGLEIKLRSQLAAQGHLARSPRSRAATAAPQMPRNIDFGRLKQFICEGQAPPGAKPSLASVLRAVLQRLTSAESRVSQRRGFLLSVACFDVFGARSHPEAFPALLSQPEVAELILGILAVLACEAVGRSYIAANLGCVEKVVQLIKAQPLDSSMHIQALAALQRLSLRRAPQDKMIELGLIEWVVGVLGSHGEGNASEFSLEFASAMLMNLAVRTKGKRKCLELDTLTVALSLMEHWNPQIRTHINGTLYTLLMVPGFRARAKHAGLDGVLKSIHAQAAQLGDDMSRRQIEYLLDQLNPLDPNSQDAGVESGEDDEDDDENFLEEEELAGLLLGDRSEHTAEEALKSFGATPAVIEAQWRVFKPLVRQRHMVPGK